MISSTLQELMDLEKTGSYVFHGSGNAVEFFEPRQAHTVIDGKKTPDGTPAVFASPFVDYAIFMALINKETFPQGYYSGCSFKNGALHFRATQETLKKFNESITGYVYLFNKDDFKKRNDSEWVSHEKIKPIKMIPVSKKDFLPPISVMDDDMA